MTAPDGSSEEFAYYLVKDRYSTPGHSAGIYRTSQDDDGNEKRELFGRVGGWMAVTEPPEGVLREITKQEADDITAQMRRDASSE